MQKLNNILIIILGLLLLNLCREYIYIKPPAVESPVVESLLKSDLNIMHKDWSYYGDVFSGEKKTIDSGQISLPIVLKGTVIGSPRRSCAIIEDVTTGVQELYSLGDTIGGAKIIAMNRNRVVVEYNGQKQELSMVVDQKVELSEAQPRSSLVCKAEPCTPWDTTGPDLDFAKVLTQVRIKPYFEEGRCIGFQLSSVRNGSLVEKIGLREGDIIETINGVRINDPLKALQLLYAVERNNPVHLGIERQSEKMELDWRLEG